MSRTAGPSPSATTAQRPQQSAVNQAPGNDLAQSQYKFNYTVFPEDIGMDYQGHYMVININVPTKDVKLPSQGLTVNKAAGAFTQYFTELNQVSKLDTLRYGNYSIPGAPDAVFAPGTGNNLPGVPNVGISIPRNTKRIAESIALFMPTPLIFNGQNAYEEVSLTALAGKLVVGAATSVINLATAASNGLASALGETLNGVVNGVAGAVGTTSKLLQSPINPAVEIVFANTIQRQFTFELLMAPRNERESMAIQKIVQTIRFHGAPEINPDYPFMWIPPADFDITFFNKGVENTKILRINTCVLERCEVDYSPTSGIYSTFRNGHPVAVRLSLGFRELEPISKARVLAGF